MEGNTPPFFLELFIKQSLISCKHDDDGEWQSACPISQKWIMVFSILTKENPGFIHLRVTGVYPDKPCKRYTDLQVGRRLPILRIVRDSTLFDPSTSVGEDTESQGVICDSDDAIDNFLQELKLSTMQLVENECLTLSVIQDLYRNFNYFLVHGTSEKMMKDLHRLEVTLSEKHNEDHKYLHGDRMGYSDCLLMPKLHHLRVVCESFKELVIPSNLIHVWSYMALMYSTDEFIKSCPEDYSLLMHYYDKVTPRPTKLAPNHGKTLTIPEGIQIQSGER